MPIWYNPPAKDSKFASFSPSKWDEINSKMTFKELAIKEDDDFYYLFGHAESATDLVNTKDRNWKFEPHLVSFKVAKKDYSKWDMNEKKNVPVPQSKVEKLFAKAFSELDLEKVYTGKLIFQDTPQIDMILNNVGFDGAELGEKMTKMMLASMASLEVVEEPEILKPSELELPKKGSWGNKGSGGQTEYEKCTDRLKFACDQLKLAFPECGELSNVGHLQALMNNPDYSTKFTDIWLLIVQPFIGASK